MSPTTDSRPSGFSRSGGFRMLVCAVLATLVSGCGAAASIPESIAEEDWYLGQTPPGPEPELFAPEIISPAGQAAFNITFMPDEREIYYTSAPVGTLVTRFEDGGWTTPEAASFSLDRDGWSPFISPDGQRLYFVSNRPPDAASSRDDSNIWVVTRTEDGWSEPEMLPEPVNSAYSDYTPFVAGDGALYFISDRPGGYGWADIYVASPTDGGYTTVENLGEPVNTPYTDEGMVVSPGGRYMILTSDREGGYGGTDLYLSVRDGDGLWQDPVNLGPAINTPGPEYAPRLSLDGGYLFFFSQNGMYWVSREALEPLLPE